MDPGWIHQALARLGLRFLRDKAESKGVTLDFGNTKEDEPLGITGDGEDGTEPVDLLSRFLAHLAYRIPGIRKLERKLEGNEKSSGIFSDLFALLVQVFRRNETEIVSMFQAELQRRATDKAEKEAAKEAARAPAPPSSDHMPSHPETVINPMDNGGVQSQPERG